MRTLVYLTLIILCVVACAPKFENLATLRIDRTFHRPIIFEVERDGSTLYLRTIIRDGQGGYDKGQIQSDTRRALTPDEASSVRSALTTVNGSSPIEPNPSDGRDGSMWYYRGDGFWPMKLEVWSPNYSAESRGTKPLSDLGLLLWRISKVEEPEKDLY